MVKTPDKFGGNIRKKGICAQVLTETWEARGLGEVPIAAQQLPMASVGSRNGCVASSRVTSRSPNQSGKGKASVRNHGHFRRCQCAIIPSFKEDRTGVWNLEEVPAILEISVLHIKWHRLVPQTKLFTREKLWQSGCTSTDVLLLRSALYFLH